MVEEEARLYRTLCQFTEMLQGDDPDTQDMNILEGLSESVATELQDDVEVSLYLIEYCGYYF